MIVPLRPIALKNCSTGISVIWIGTTIRPTITMKKMFLPGKFIQANA